MKLFTKTNPFFIIIYGPTGVGKTDLSYDLAQILPCAQIINADLGQLYTSLTIGTAKPDWQAAPVPHHLFDVLDKPIDFSVRQYRQQVLSLMSDFWDRGIIPIIVGGSGFYIKSLLFPPSELELRKNMAPVSCQKNGTDAWKQLASIDPERAAKIHPNDIYRINRALEIWYTTGRQPSCFVPHYNPPANYLLIHLTRTRDDLYARINRRVDSMFEQGWMHEVASLLGTEWEPFLQEKKLIGYDDIICYLHGEKYKDTNELRVIIAQKTRNYAKRQETFWRMFSHSIEQAPKGKDSHRAFTKSMNLTLSSVDLYIKELLQEIVWY